MKKIFILALALLLALALCACGSSDDGANSMYGTYTLYAMDYGDGSIYPTDGLFDGENYITLKSGGVAEMCLEDDVATIKWEADGADLLFTASDGEMEGRLQNGILTLVVEGLNLYFIGEDVSPDDFEALLLGETAEGAAGEQTEVQQMWNGWWYGCADITGSERGWEWANGMTFDAVMYVELDEEGYGTLSIYDPYNEIAAGYPDNNRYIYVNCHADDMYIYGDSGTNFGYDIYVNDWRVVRNLDNADKIHVGSSYTDNDGNKMGFDFTFLPWGDRWESEDYSRFIPHFDEYLAMLDAGMSSPFDAGSGSTGSSGEQTTPAPSGASGGNSALLGSSPAKLDVNNKGAVYVYYPADRFTYDADYGMLKNADSGVNIMVDPMLGSTNFDELRKSYEENNSDEEDYSLVETTVNGYRALILKYTDWLDSTMRVDIDFGGAHDGFYGMSFSVSGDSLADCDTDLVWAVIESMEVVK